MMENEKVCGNCKHCVVRGIYDDIVYRFDCECDVDGHYVPAYDCECVCNKWEMV